MEDLADKAIGYIHQQKAIAPDKPFFVYFAPGATHAPHHVPKDPEFSGQVNWVEFDAGTAADDHNHLITPEERLQVAMAKQ